MPEETDKIDFKRREEEFESLYANNVQFEASVWDLKMIFGQLDQSTGSTVVEQHTAVTMAWPEAKIMAYFLLVNMTGYQSRNGPIQLPIAVIPTRPDPSDPSLNADGKKLAEYLAWVHDQFFSDHPYIPPGLTGGMDVPKPTE